MMYRYSRNSPCPILVCTKSVILCGGQTPRVDGLRHTQRVTTHPQLTIRANPRRSAAAAAVARESRLVRLKGRQQSSTHDSIEPSSSCSSLGHPHSGRCCGVWGGSPEMSEGGGILLLSSLALCRSHIGPQRDAGPRHGDFPAILSILHEFQHSSGLSPGPAITKCTTSQAD